MPVVQKRTKALCIEFEPHGRGGADNSGFHVRSLCPLCGLRLQKISSLSNDWYGPNLSEGGPEQKNVSNTDITHNPSYVNYFALLATAFGCPKYLGVTFIYASYARP